MNAHDEDDGDDGKFAAASATRCGNGFNSSGASLHSSPQWSLSLFVKPAIGVGLLAPNGITSWRVIDIGEYSYMHMYIYTYIHYMYNICIYIYMSTETGHSASCVVTRGGLYTGRNISTRSTHRETLPTDVTRAWQPRPVSSTRLATYTSAVVPRIDKHVPYVYVT